MWQPTSGAETPRLADELLDHLKREYAALLERYGNEPRPRPRIADGLLEAERAATLAMIDNWDHLLCLGRPSWAAAHPCYEHLHPNSTALPNSSSITVTPSVRSQQNALPLPDGCAARPFARMVSAGLRLRFVGVDNAPLLVYIQCRYMATTTQLSKWGNSLGLRLPKSVAREVQLGEGDTVQVSVDNGTIV